MKTLKSTWFVLLLYSSFLLTMWSSLWLRSQFGGADSRVFSSWEVRPWFPSHLWWYPSCTSTKYPAFWCILINVTFDSAEWSVLDLLVNFLSIQFSILSIHRKNPERWEFVDSPLPLVVFAPFQFTFIAPLSLGVVCKCKEFAVLLDWLSFQLMLRLTPWSEL